MSDIFISHVEEDADLAIDLAAALEASGYSTWYYERDSLPGPSYLLQTSREIERSQAVVLIISPDSLGSHQVTKEVIRAHESGKRFVPLLKSTTHAEFTSRQPEWKEAVGSTTSITVPRRGITTIVPRILDGLGAMGVEPTGDKTEMVAGEFQAAVTAGKKPLFRLGSLKVFPLTAIIATVIIATLITGGLVFGLSGSKDSPTNGQSSEVAQGQFVLRPAGVSDETDASAQLADTAEAPVSTREVKTSAGIVLIDGVKASDRYMECAGVGRCTQRAGGKFILGITYRSAEGKSAQDLQRDLSQEALSSHVKTPAGNRVEAFNFDPITGKSSITVIYAYMDSGITSGLVLYWKGNPPIAIGSGGSSAPGSTSGSTGGSSAPTDSSSDDGSFDDGSFDDGSFDDEEPWPDEEEFPDEEPPPDEEFPDEEPPPDEEFPEEEFPEDEPLPDE